ncbi:MAG: hypothetical protein ACI88H_000392 [Cocleimonas sp.]|jgi:hypothetical protein
MTMRIRIKKMVSWIKTLQVSVLLIAAIVPQASAHLMVAQHGTLNFKGSGAFIVLSVPISAFTNINDDGDGKLSSSEFKKTDLLLIILIKRYGYQTKLESNHYKVYSYHL